MTVTLATWGRFHFFDLARELSRSGVLDRLHTSYPGWAATRFGVPKANVVASADLEVASRVAVRLGLRGIQPALVRMWDARVARRLQPCDLFVGLSGFCVKSISRARELGAITVLERASSHIRTQAQLLQEEAELMKAKVPQVSTLDIEREEAGYALADYVLVPSSFAADSFRAKGFPARRLRMNPLGVDLAHFRPRPDARPRDPAAPLRIVNAGALTHQKGIHYLIDAACILDSRRFEFAHIGFRGRKPPFAVPSNFLIRPRVLQSKLIDHYHQADVFVLPTIQDGFPVVIPQAMAAGLPVITTPNGSGPDLIRDGDNGFIVPIRDARAIAERLEWMYAHPVETFAMGLRARQAVANGFSWEDYRERTLKLYRSLETHQPAAERHSELALEDRHD